MNHLIEECMLTNEQRHLILKGIAMGKEEFNNLNESLPETTTKKHQPYLQSDLINTYVEKVIKENPHTQMRVYKKKAGLHPYIVIQDTIRNIFVLISKLPKNKYLIRPSVYRGEFASSNFDRLVDMGVPEEELIEDSFYQQALPLGTENQPFGIVICYDGKRDAVFEGALRPDQEDWIFKEDITDTIDIQADNFIPLNTHNLSDIELPLKPVGKKDIPLKFKNDSTS